MVCTLTSASSATGTPPATTCSRESVIAEDSEIPYGYWTPVRQLPLGANAHRGDDGTAGIRHKQRLYDVSYIGAA